MGGQGSGRPPSAKTIAQRMNGTREENNGSSFNLPNNSGDHMRGIKRQAPVQDYDLVNKIYCDSQIAGENHWDMDGSTSYIYPHVDGINIALNDGWLTNDGGNEGIRIDNDGNVGIGTTTPINKLTIAESDGTAAVLRLENSEGSSSITSDGGDLKFATDNDATPFTRMTILDGGNVGIGITNPLKKLSIDGATNDGLMIEGVGTTATRVFAGLDAGDDGILQLTDSSGGVDIQIASSGDSYFNGGNVGIGTTTPQNTLDVAGEITISDASPKLYFNETDSGTGLWNLWSSSGNLHFRQGAGTASFVLEDGGNVGIGTTTPGVSLEIGSKETGGDHGNLFVKSDSNHRAIHIEENSGSEGWMLGVQADGNLFFDNSAAGAAVTFQDDGNVGIGVTDPHSTLEVSGAISSATTTFSTAGPTDNVDVSGVNVIFADTSSNNVTIGGFTGGVAGQVLYITKTSTSNTLTLENVEGTGNQDIYLHSASDETIIATKRGGFVLVCDGSNWYDVEHR